MAVKREDIINHSDADVAGYEAYPQWLKERLEEFMDWRLGFMMHWAPYSQWDCMESWSICPEIWDWNRTDKMESWTSRNKDLKKFTEDYFALNTTFNPVKFDPDAWAELAAWCGFKYVNFTTKHHDGFCMWDTKTTDYKITDPSCPFSANPKANIVPQVWDAFRKRGFAVECYFSKSDWHCPWYWLKDRPVEDRNPNYEPAEHPEIWDKFKAFVHAQIDELMSLGHKIDVLWLDGGQVRPPQQDIDMDAIVAKARLKHPGMMVADRTVGGVNENIITPEQEIPDRPLGVPWESCLTLSAGWKYVPKEEYKSAQKVITMIVETISKGGNFLLNVAPHPDGTIPEGAVARLKEIGAWVRVNGEAIYGTRELAPYAEGPVRYTCKGRKTYAFILPDATGAFPATASLSLPPVANSTMTLLGGGTVPYAVKDGRCHVTLPPADSKALCLAYERF